MVDDDGETCQPAGVGLDAVKNAALFKSGPKTWTPKAKITVGYLVTYDCTNALKQDVSAGPEVPIATRLRCTTRPSVGAPTVTRTTIAARTTPWGSS